ncbi:MAG: hypothetical protein HY720_04910, partial [Planctomycetes bacterium]|nr:hypothetical protein [Planctomycetota bacterium]
MSAFPTFASKARYVAARWRPHRIFLVFLALFTLVSSAVTVAYPLALKQVIDGVERALRAAAGGERGSGGEALPPGRQ